MTSRLDFGILIGFITIFFAFTMLAISSKSAPCYAVAYNAQGTAYSTPVTCPAGTP